MKRLILVMAIVFAFGVTFANSNTTEVQKARTEKVSTINKDDKDKKEAKTEKKESCTEKKACCGTKSSCDKKEAKSCCSDKKAKEEKE